MICINCRWNYPEGIVNAAFINGQYFNLCGICYEEIVGITLHGEMACLARDRAIEYRKNNPRKVPHKAQNNRIK